MNQQQRRYIVRELETIKYNKLKEARSGNSNKVKLYNDGLSEISKLFKETKIAINSDIDMSLRAEGAINWIGGVYATKIIKRGYASIDDNGGFVITNSNMVKSINEMSHKMLSVKEEWNCGIRFDKAVKYLKSIVDEDSSKLIDGIATSIGKSQSEELIHNAYKEAERMVMLGDSEEMIQVIADFENAKF